MAGDFPDKGFAAKCHTHLIESLVELAGLKAQRDADVKASVALQTNWVTAGAWSESSRYAVKTEAEAKSLYTAHTDPSDGVLPWIKLRW
jgi:hypothetical protein